MADRAGSTHVCSEGREEGGALPEVPGAQVVAEDYLDELKRFAAALNGLPAPEAEFEAAEPTLVAAAPPSRGPDEAADWQVDEGGEHEWWRELDARLARAPRRPRFAVRHSKRPVPPVTHTAAATEAPIPPPQLRRRIDIHFGSGDEAPPVHKTGWDRLDSLFGVAGLTVVLLGAVAASAPIAPGTVQSKPAVTIDLVVGSVEIAPAEELQPFAESSAPAGPVTLLLPPPPPFPVTVALVSEAAVGSYVGPIGDRAFNPIALARATGSSLDREAVGERSPAALVEPGKAIDIAPRQEPLALSTVEAEKLVVSAVELAEADAKLPPVQTPISEPQALLLTNADAVASNDAKVTAAAASDRVAADLSPKGIWLVHLVSFRDENGAAGEWDRLQKQHAALGSLELSVKRVDLGDKGIWFRVFAGRFESRQDASRLCAILTGQYCQPSADDRG